MSLGNLGSQKSRLSFNVRLMFSPLESWGDVPTGQTRKAREQNSRKCVASSHWQPEPWLPVPLDICSCNSSYIFSVTVILTCFRSSSAESKMQAKVSEMLNLIIFGQINLLQGFLHSSVGKESTCNAGDPGSIPGSGRSGGEGIGHPLQCSWASIMVQLVKNPPAMWETWVQSLGWEDPPGEGKGYPLQCVNSMDYTVHGVAKSWT